MTTASMHRETIQLHRMDELRDSSSTREARWLLQSVTALRGAQRVELLQHTRLLAAQTQDIKEHISVSAEHLRAAGNRSTHNGEARFTYNVAPAAGPLRASVPLSMRV